MSERKTTSAKVIADSISFNDFRLTTFEVTFHRYVLAEFNTHRVFSRNSASSRAIPTRKQLETVTTNPAMPYEWGANQPGMQAAEPLEGKQADEAAYYWIKANHAAVDTARHLAEGLGVHKQVTNRVLEPWMWHTVIVTATDYSNFFSQRCSPLAQPEIRIAAEMMRDAYEASEPTQVAEGFWHTPYIQEDEMNLSPETRKKISAARCARVSYLTHDGERNIDKDLELYERLVTAQPPHSSPLEHVATPSDRNVAFIQNREAAKVREVPILGNLTGWKQLCHEVAGEDIFIW